MQVENAILPLDIFSQLQLVTGEKFLQCTNHFAMKHQIWRATETFSRRLNKIDDDLYPTIRSISQKEQGSPTKSSVPEVIAQIFYLVKYRGPGGSDKLHQLPIVLFNHHENVDGRFHSSIGQHSPFPRSNIDFQCPFPINQGLPLVALWPCDLFFLGTYPVTSNLPSLLFLFYPSYWRQKEEDSSEFSNVASITERQLWKMGMVLRLSY